MLDSRISKALAAFEDESNRRMADANAANAPTLPLFHFTREQALTSIIGSEQLWFTSIYHMDDPEELTFGFNQSRVLLEEAIAVKNGLARAFCQDVLEIVDLKTITMLIAFYSISFGLRDDLQQWNSYGDQGRGAALGLAPEFFRPASCEDPDHPKPEEEVFYRKVSYGHADARERHRGVIEPAFALIERVEAAGWLRTKEEAATFGKDLTALMYPEILWNCITTKDGKWSHQNETRILVRNFLKKPLLPIVNAERPRVEITQPLLRRSIVEVMIGPKAAPGALTRMRKFLVSVGLPAVPVTRSGDS